MKPAIITNAWILAFFLYNCLVGDTKAQFFSIGDFRISKKGEFHENVSMTLPADASVEYDQQVLIIADNEDETGEDEERLSAKKDFGEQLAFDSLPPRVLTIAKSDDNVSAANKRTADIGLVYVNFDESGDDSNRKEFAEGNDILVEEADGKEVQRLNGSSVTVKSELPDDDKKFFTDGNKILEVEATNLEMNEGMTVGDEGSVIVNGSYEDGDGGDADDTLRTNEVIDTNFVSNQSSVFVNRFISGAEEAQIVELSLPSDEPMDLALTSLTEGGDEATEEEERVSRSFLKGVNLRYSPATYNSHNRPPWAANSAASVTQQPSSESSPQLQHRLRQRGSIFPIVRPVKAATTVAQPQSVIAARRPMLPNAKLAEKVVVTLPQSHRPHNKQRGEGVFNTPATPKSAIAAQPLPLNTIPAHHQDDTTHTSLTDPSEGIPSGGSNMSVVHSGRIGEASAQLTQRFLLLPIFDGAKQLKIDQSMLAKMMNMDAMLGTSTPNEKGDTAEANAAVERFLHQIIDNSNGQQFRNDPGRPAENTSAVRVVAGGAATHPARSADNSSSVRVPAFCRRCYGFWRNVAAQHVPDQLMLEYCCTAGTNKGRLFLKRKPASPKP